jgi:protein-L-isoaspartate(D-aspartate) O-methyltransferase
MTYQQEVLFKQCRTNMVNGQLLANGIHAPALVQAYFETPRENFVDLSLAAKAYLDEDVNITGTTRWLLEPLVEARMLQHALAGECRTALAIGAASLPSIEMLAAFVGQLVVVEPDRGLASAAQLRLARPNVDVIEADYKQGCAKHAPYDVIVITGAVACVPQILLPQMAVGGRLVTVLREKPNAAGRIIMMRRLAIDYFDTIYDENASTPYLQGFELKTGFVF